MHTKKTRWLVVVAALVLAAVLAGQGVVQVRQAREKNELTEELRHAEQGLSRLEAEQSPFDRTEMNERLSDALAHFDTARIDLSQLTDSIIANKAFFDLAAESGVTLTEITASAESSAKLGEVTLAVLPFTIGAEGEVSQLLNFVEVLNTDLANGVVTAAKLTVPGTTGERLPSASIELAIYVYRGG